MNEAVYSTRSRARAKSDTIFNCPAEDNTDLYENVLFFHFLKSVISCFTTFITRNIFNSIFSVLNIKFVPKKFTGNLILPINVLALVLIGNYIYN